MRHITQLCIVLVLVAGGRAFAQSLPTTQPNLVQVFIEEVKVGHDADHVRTETGWPLAFEKAKSPYFTLGLSSLTGRSEAWFLVPFDSHQAMGDSLKRQSDDPALAAELARLSRADAEHINSFRSVLLAARKDLSHGAFPEISKQRFWDLTVFRVRPGHEAEFAVAAKAYASASSRSAPNASFRVYEVAAGMPSPTYIVFASVETFADFDKMQADGEATMKGLNTEEQSALQKFSTDALITAETQRFRLDPEMSYVPKEVKAQDPAFWTPRRPTGKKPSQ